MHHPVVHVIWKLYVIIIEQIAIFLDKHDTAVCGNGYHSFMWEKNIFFYLTFIILWYIIHAWDIYITYTYLWVYKQWRIQDFLNWGGTTNYKQIKLFWTHYFNHRINFSRRCQAYWQLQLSWLHSCKVCYLGRSLGKTS